MCGNRAIAGLLRQHGATTTLSAGDEQAFVRACLSLDRDAAAALAARHAEFLRSPLGLFAAARHNRADAIELLLSLGTPVDVADDNDQRALHVAAAADARDAAATQRAHGAGPDGREARYHSTPLGFAAHHHHVAMMKLLTPTSHDVFNLAQSGEVRRLLAVLSEDPTLARSTDRNGFTPLWWLPPDDDQALQVVDALLAAGTNPLHVAENGTTAAMMARRRGLDRAADRIQAAIDERNRPGVP